jgi:non-ribosomal peptide synthetase component F
MNQLVSTSTTEHQTLVDLLRWRAQHQAHQRAYTFLLDGEEDAVHLTYAELDQQARAIGAWLQEMEATGERVYPARYLSSNRRLKAIVRDAQPIVVLSDSR